MNIEVKDLLDLNYTISKEIFNKVKYPHEILPLIKEYIIEIGNTLNKDEFNEIEKNIWIHKTAKISNKATIESPCIIDANTEVRPGAYLRGNVIIGKNCVIGNSCEFKNSLVFDDSQIPHFNYVGDSVLGHHSHLGAGVILSNLKSDKSNIIIKGNSNLETNLRKMGAIIGDNSEVGCNSVLCPGSIIGRNTNIYPLTRVRGVIPENSIMKNENTIIKKEEHYE